MDQDENGSQQSETPTHGLDNSEQFNGVNQSLDLIEKRLEDYEKIRESIRNSQESDHKFAPREAQKTQEKPVTQIDTGIQKQTRNVNNILSHGDNLLLNSSLHESPEK